MSDPVGLLDLYRRFRRGSELRPLVCLATSVATGLLLGGLGLGAGWLRGMLRPAWAAGRIGDVRDPDLIVGAVVGAAAWLGLLFWIWRPAVRLQRHSRGLDERPRGAGPILACAGLAAGVVLVTVIIGQRPWDDVEWATTALSLAAAGLGLLAWLPAIFRLEHGRPVIGPGDRVNVHCPDCGYSLAGLRGTACPECGWSGTLDEVIRAQGYRGSDEG